jgi:hypothetical protein
MHPKHRQEFTAGVYGWSLPRLLPIIKHLQRLKSLVALVLRVHKAHSCGECMNGMTPDVMNRTANRVAIYLHVEALDYTREGSRELICVRFYVRPSVCVRVRARVRASSADCYNCARVERKLIGNRNCRCARRKRRRID